MTADEIFIVNDPELGPVTDGCSGCRVLRELARELTERQRLDESVHPNEFLAVFTARLAHEEKTGHTTFGWRFLLEARKQAKAFAAEGGPLAVFWGEFAERYLVTPAPPPLPEATPPPSPAPSTGSATDEG